MSETGYTPEFWTRATMLANAPLKMCEKCYRKHGDEITHETKKRKPKKRTFVVVRPALRVGKRIAVWNLGLFCTKCKKGGVRKPPAAKPAEMMESLFGT